MLGFNYHVLPCSTIYSQFLTLMHGFSGIEVINFHYWLVVRPWDAYLAVESLDQKVYRVHPFTVLYFKYDIIMVG